MYCTYIKYTDEQQHNNKKKTKKYSNTNATYTIYCSLTQTNRMLSLTKNLLNNKFKFQLSITGH